MPDYAKTFSCGFQPKSRSFNTISN